MRFLYPVLALLCLALSGSLAAQTLTIGNATVPFGSNTAVVPVTFTPGATPVAGYQVSFSFTRFLPVAVSGTVAVTPGDGTCDGPGTTDPTGTQINISDSGAGALTAGTVCTLSFPLEVPGLLGFYPFTVMTSQFTDLGGGTVAGTVIPGGISVVDGGPTATPPTLSYAPATGSTVLFMGPSGPTLFNTIAVTGSGGAGTGGDATARVSNCLVNPVSNPAAFVCNPTAGANLDFLPGVDAGDIECACLLPPGSTASATLTCDETRPLSTGLPVARSWNLSCTTDVAAVASVPVPVLGDAGRLSLAALVLLLGVAVLGSRLASLR